MKFRCSIAAVSLALGFSAFWAQGAPGDPVPLFQLNFENGFNAIGNGGGAPTNTDHLPTLVAGIRGKAAFFKQGQVLRYLEKGNLDKQHGSIAMWVQSCVSANGAETSADPLVAGRRYTLFREDAPNVVGGNATWLWLLGGGPGLRFDVRDPKDSYLFAAEASEPWKKGEWHHVVATWDVDKGSQVYVDGFLAASHQIDKWQPKTHEGFFIGAFDAAGIQAWDAAIDEVVIYDQPLTAEQVRKEYLRFGKFSAAIRSIDPYVSAGKPESVQVTISNPDVKPLAIGAVRFELANQEGRVVLSGSMAGRILKGASSDLFKAAVVVPAPGAYKLTLHYSEDGIAKVFTGDITAVAAKEAAPASPSLRTFVTEVDAANREPLSEAGKSTVVASSLGAYREAGKAMRDRFLMNFDITDVDAPHLAVITYPDDKPRTMEVILQDLTGFDDYQAQTGVFTGDEYATTQKMIEHSFVFWPHSTKQSLIFMTAEQGHPAAVKNIKIYRLDHLSAAVEKGVFKGSVPSRSIGIYYEDCVLNQNFGEPVGLEGFAKSTDRFLDYMQSFGQNTFCYPIAWYNGPLYGTRVEPRQPDVGGAMGGDRPHPKGFPGYFLKRADARGMKFNAGLHIHWLPSLDPYTITDIQRVVAGEDTVVNVRGDGKLWWGHWHGADPNYNPTDPRVMNAVKSVVDEIGDRYGKEPAFEGVTFVMSRPKLFQFGSIESGYNDVNLRGFQKDTGIKIPTYGDAKADRFSASYKWLMANPDAKKAWIDWRCRKLHTQYKSIADSLSARRADLKVTINAFVPVSLEPRAADYLSGPTVEILRESGIDPALYAKDANIVMSYTLVPAEYRWERSLGEKSPAAEARRTAAMAPETGESFLALPRAEVIIHDRYWEDPVGKKSPLKGLSSNPKVHECTWRVSTLNGSGYNSMETYMAALNNFDAVDIKKGGFLIGTFGMEKELQAFSAAFRALPAVRFDDVKGVEDPVRVRQKVVDGQLYFYALNRLPEPVTIKIALKEKGTIEDPTSGESVRDAGQITLQLAPYGLRTFRVAAGSNMVVGAETIVSQEWIGSLGQRLEEIKNKVNASSPTENSKATPYLAMAERCWKTKQYARLHFLLQESWAMK